MESLHVTLHWRSCLEDDGELTRRFSLVEAVISSSVGLFKLASTAREGRCGGESLWSAVAEDGLLAIASEPASCCACSSSTRFATDLRHSTSQSGLQIGRAASKPR